MLKEGSFIVYLIELPLYAKADRTGGWRLKILNVTYNSVAIPKALLTWLSGPRGVVLRKNEKSL
jgi:hypothetical protein